LALATFIRSERGNSNLLSRKQNFSHVKSSGQPLPLEEAT
jgi:hypothetical protein